MRIIKYIFLLILLAIIGVTVYIATQDGKYLVQRSVQVKMSRQVVFTYLNDYRNWEQWSHFGNETKDTKFEFPESTVGSGGSFSWIGNENHGKVQTTFVKENDSIAQKLSIYGKDAVSSIRLKDSLGGTKITWLVEGTTDFSTKVKAAFSGGIDNMVAAFSEKSLDNLKQVLTKEINTYDIQVGQVIQKNETFYVKQTATAKVDEVHSRINPMMQKMIHFFKSNNLVMNGSPFVIYESSDSQKKTITFSVCGPTSEAVLLSPQSDISTGKLEAFSALKTTLIGDYSHRDEAVTKALKHLSDKNIPQNTALKYIDIYTKNAADEKSPSKWVTEILIPIQQAPVITPPVTVTPPVITTKDMTVE